MTSSRESLAAPPSGRFNDLVREQVATDPAFRGALLREAVACLLAGDLETGKSILRNYIKATTGYARLSAGTGTQEKSLIRMFGPRGNPQARNLLCVIAYLQDQAGVAFELTLAQRSPRRGKARSAPAGTARPAAPRATRRRA